MGYACRAVGVIGCLWAIGGALTALFVSSADTGDLAVAITKDLFVVPGLVVAILGFGGEAVIGSRKP